jgi:alkylation response protein AidB-like acyl-CoA dehydrogenase
VDFALSPAAEKFRARFVEWLDAELPEEWRNYSMHGSTFDEVVEVRRAWGRLLHAGGWAGPSWPVAHGGLGLGTEELTAYCEELVRCGAPEPMNSNAIGILAPTIMKYGTVEQKERFLPPMLAHDELWCQGFSEPAAGSDLAGLATTATHDPGDGVYRINGQKLWTSRGQYADWCYVLARTGQGSKRHEGISMMLMPMHQPGVDVRPLRNITGSSEFNELFLTDATAQDCDVIGPVGDGWQVANFALSNERGPRLIERALTFKQEQTKGLEDLMGTWDDGPSAGVDAVPDSMVAAHIDARVVDAMAHRILALTAEGASVGVLASMSKLIWSEGYQRFLSALVEAFGADGASDVAPFAVWQDRLLRSRAGTIYGGTSEVQRNIIAKSLGLPASGPR